MIGCLIYHLRYFPWKNILWFQLIKCDILTSCQTFLVYYWRAHSTVPLLFRSLTWQKSKRTHGVKCSLIFHLLSCKRLRSTQWLLILQVHTSTEELFPFCAHVSGPYSTGERTSLFIILFSTIFFSHLCQCLCPLHYTTQLNKRCKLQVLQQVQ